MSTRQYLSGSAKRKLKLVQENINKKMAGSMDQFVKKKTGRCVNIINKCRHEVYNNYTTRCTQKAFIILKFYVPHYCYSIRILKRLKVKILGRFTCLTLKMFNIKL